MNNCKTRRIILRYVLLFCGLFMMANGIVSTINANFGVNPWDVFHVGVAGQLNLSIGKVMQATGLLLIAASWIAKVKPYTGTVLNMFFVGYFTDLIISWGYIPRPDYILLKGLLYFSGVILSGFGIAFYMSASLGTGPRDSVMLAISGATGIRLGRIRTIMEATAAGTGFLLGGPLGFGTVIYALTIGHFMELGLALVKKFKNTALFHCLWPIEGKE